ncbi:MAG: TIGR03905 family TSCPD domain-containing protein [Muribaculaceae bacterium]
MHIDYEPQGVCSRLMSVDVDADGIVADVKVVGGCHGNLQGICALVKGRPAAEVIDTLRGIRCRDKLTSCPDQLACALSKALGK